MREEIVEPLLADEELEPAVESLWWVSASQREPGSPAWLKTSGLNRLGLPELEFLEVPVPLVPTSAHLLDELAARIAEDGPPPPGTRMAVGPELELRAVLDHHCEQPEEHQQRRTADHNTVITWKTLGRTEVYLATPSSR